MYDRGCKHGVNYGVQGDMSGLFQILQPLGNLFNGNFEQGWNTLAQLCGAHARNPRFLTAATQQNALGAAVEAAHVQDFNAARAMYLGYLLLSALLKAGDTERFFQMGLMDVWEGSPYAESGPGARL